MASGFDAAVPLKPRRVLDAVAREGFQDLVAEGDGRKLIKSRDFSQEVDLDFRSVQVVLFDLHSTDSFAACCVARMALGENAEYEAVTRGGFIGQLDTDVTGKTVAMLGVSWTVDCMHEMAWSCEALVVMDNQTSVERVLAQYMQTYHAIVFIDSMMGAGVMAWNFFNPGEPVPVMLRALEDAHLGRYALRDGREFEDGIDAILDYPITFGPLRQNNQAFKHFMGLLQDDRAARHTIRQAIEEGSVVSKCVQTMCGTAMQRMRVLSLRAFPSLICALVDDASPFQGRLAEHLANQLAQRLGPSTGKRCFAAAFEVRGSRVRVVLRSKPGGADVSHIAEYFEGAGAQSRGFFTIAVDAWEGIWAQPETILWDAPSTTKCCLALTRGDLVTIISRDQHFRDSPCDAWSWGYKTQEPEVEGWIPTLAHTMFLATQTRQSSGPGVHGLEEGQLIIGIGQRGNFLYGWILGESGSKGWFPFSEDWLRPVQPSSAARLAEELKSCKAQGVVGV